MGAIHVHEFMSLDGVIDAPTWTFEYGFDPKMGERIGALTERSRGILLGRTTFEMFAQAWPNRTVEEDPGAPFFNDTTKYVVSGTLTDPNATWRNSEVVGPYDPDAIRRLKDEVAADLYTSGSGTLVHALLADGLVDELHLLVYPLTRGSGPRLFAEGAAPLTLSLAASESYENGVVYLNYPIPGGGECAGALPPACQGRGGAGRGWPRIPPSARWPRPIGAPTSPDVPAAGHAADSGQHAIALPSSSPPSRVQLR